MDCDRFERVMMDVLYDELDELSRAAASRHLDQCKRCSGQLARLKATREVGTVPLEAAPEHFERRVMEAERQVRAALPLRARLSRQLIILAGYATRPQLAMAALALLMIGSSLLFLRPSPGTRPVSTQVSDQGIVEQPESVVVPIDQAPPLEFEEQAPERAPPNSTSAVAAGRSPESAKAPGSVSSAALAAEQVQEHEAELDKARARAEDRAYTAAMSAFRANDYLSAQTQFDAIVAARGQNAAAAELYAALASEQALGCASALPRFDSVSAKNGANHLGHMATWHSASCRSKLGRTRRAALDFEKLLKVPTYAHRAKAALGQLGAEVADEPAVPTVTVEDTSAPVAPALSPAPSATETPVEKAATDVVTAPSGRGSTP